MDTLYVNEGFKVVDEELVIHPTIEVTKSGNMSGDARIIGVIEVDGKKYSFNRVIRVVFKEEEEV